MQYPAVDSESNADIPVAETQSESTPSLQELLLRQEKISLNSIMGQGKRTTKTTATLEPENKKIEVLGPVAADEKACAVSILPPEIIAKLTSHECYLLEQQPSLAKSS